MTNERERYSGYIKRRVRFTTLTDAMVSTGLVALAILLLVKFV